MLGYPWGWLVAIILIGIVATAVCYAPIRMNAVVQREGSDDHIKLEIRTLFGLLRYQWEVPLIRFGKHGIDVRRQTDLDQGCSGHP